MKINGDILMKKIILLILIFASFLFAQETQLIVLHTTDVHGNIYPYNYFTDSPAQNGLAKIYTVVKKFRKHYSNVLLLDGGDLLQGTPLIYYYNHIESLPVNPMIYAMNFMRYDAFTVGNHDIEQGYATYYKAREESHFPWLSANGVRDDGSAFFEPYKIIKKGDIKIGVIGLTTPAIPMWLDESLYPGITWKGMVESVKRWVQFVRPQVDILVGLFHAGMNEDYSKTQTDALGLPNENASRLIAQNVPEFDLILCGHSHRMYPENKNDPHLINGVQFLMSASHARFLGVAEINLEQVGDNWEIKKRKSYFVKMDSVEAASEILTIIKPYHLQTLKYTGEIIGTVSDTISAKISRWRDNALVEIINRAQMYTTDADISFAASFNDDFVLLPGNIKVKDVYGMYKYENFLYVLEMTGMQIKNYLEYSSDFYQYDVKEKRLIKNPNVAGYNYDMAEGISYEIDVSEKTGERIKNIKYLKTGKLLEADKIYRVALNSYRASGGGGHLAAAGIKNAKIIWKSSEEMRNILIDYIKNKRELNSKIDNNWKIVGLRN